MKKPEMGNKVKIAYTTSLANGEIVDANSRDDPLEITLGKGEIFQIVEETIMDMSIGETRKVKITSERAFGHQNKELIFTFDRNLVADNLEVKVGQRAVMKIDDDKSIPVTITAVSEKSVTVDGNHPLAGKNLVFEIELLEVA